MLMSRPRGNEGEFRQGGQSPTTVTVGGTPGLDFLPCTSEKDYFGPTTRHQHPCLGMNEAKVETEGAGGQDDQELLLLLGLWLTFSLQNRPAEPPCRTAASGKMQLQPSSDETGRKNKKTKHNFQSLLQHGRHEGGQYVSSTTRSTRTRL